MDLQLFADRAEAVTLKLLERGIRQSPFSPVDGRPMRRAGATELKTLIDVEDGAESRVSRL